MNQYDFFFDGFVVPILATNGFNAVIQFMSYRIKKDDSFKVDKVQVWDEEKRDITEAYRKFVSDILKLAGGVR